MIDRLIWRKGMAGACRPCLFLWAIAACFAVAPKAAASQPLAPPYRYVTLAEAPSEAALELAQIAGGGAVAEVLALAAPDGAGKAARVEALRSPGGALVVVGWTNLGREPVLRPDIDPAEELALVRALSAHLPQGARVLAMPERSRRLARLSASDLPLAGAPLTGTLRIPGPWLGAAEMIAASEAARDGIAPTEAGARLWREARDALLAPAADGTARLAVLGAGAAGTYLVLHVSDAFQLGIDGGDRLAMVQRDLPPSDVHASARQVKLWRREGGYPAYAVQSRADRGLRAYFLTDPADLDLMIVRLLPFSTSDIAAAPGARLVWQGGGYWVWRLGPASDARQGAAARAD